MNSYSIIILLGIVVVMMLTVWRGHAVENPLKLTFVKEYQIRNFFNSAQTLFKLDVSGKKHIKEQLVNMTESGCADIKTHEWELVGDMCFYNGDGVLRQWQSEL